MSEDDCIPSTKGAVAELEDESQRDAGFVLVSSLMSLHGSAIAWMSKI